MAAIKDKILPKEFEAPNDKKVLSNTEKNVAQAQKKETLIASHTEANMNWAAIANKITVPNAVKVKLTLGGGYVGSLLGKGLFTGLGFAVGGPGGAVAGYYTGSLLGLGAGIVGGYRFGQAVANKLEDREREDIIEVGITKVNVNTATKVNAKKGDRQR